MEKGKRERKRDELKMVRKEERGRENGGREGVRREREGSLILDVNLSR